MLIRLTSVTSDTPRRGDLAIDAEQVTAVEELLDERNRRIALVHILGGPLFLVWDKKRSVIDRIAEARNDFGTAEIVIDD